MISVFINKNRIMKLEHLTNREPERDWIKLKQEASHIDSPSVDKFIKSNNNKNK